MQSRPMVMVETDQAQVRTTAGKAAARCPAMSLTLGMKANRNRADLP